MPESELIATSELNSNAQLQSKRGAVRVVRVTVLLTNALLHVGGGVHVEVILHSTHKMSVRSAVRQE